MGEAGRGCLIVAAGRTEAGIAPYPALDRVGQNGPMADYTHTIDRWDDATGENLIEQPSPVPVLFGLALRFHPLKDLLAVSLERAKALVQGVLNRFSRCCGVAS